ncbi:unnamed protein product, partial [Anisakis simplex]|uniref:Growth hormone receptor n=1 Tax=Anisakis simplex TaxID=6269 RepID=A0A0M3J9V3_ANISI
SPQVQAKVTFATNDEHSNTFGNSTSSSFGERFVDEDPWPSSSTSSGTSTENSSDAWANFSMKTSDWPPKGVEHDVLQNDANGWPSLSGQSDQTPFPTHIPGLPVADGIACAIIAAPVMEK